MKKRLAQERVELVPGDHTGRRGDRPEDPDVLVRDDDRGLSTKLEGELVEERLGASVQRRSVAIHDDDPGGVDPPDSLVHSPEVFLESELFPVERRERLYIGILPAAPILKARDCVDGGGIGDVPDAGTEGGCPSSDGGLGKEHPFKRSIHACSKSAQNVTQTNDFGQ